MISIKSAAESWIGIFVSEELTNVIYITIKASRVIQSSFLSLLLSLLDNI